MFPDASVELVPPRPDSPHPRLGALAQTSAVELPNDVLRLIFELAVVGDMWTARRLLATATWVYEWIADDVYTTIYIRNKSDMLAFTHSSDRCLALVRNIWVKARSRLLIPLLARMPNIERMAISLSAVRMYGWAGLREKWGVRSVFPPGMHLREFELTNPELGYSPSRPFYCEFNAPAFHAVTHLRLGYIDSAHADRLSSPNWYWSNVSVLTHLTHLAFDADPGMYGYSSPHISEVKYYRRILQSPERTALRRLVIVMPPAKDRDAQSHAEELLALHMPRLVVLVESLDLPLRRRDWKARTLAESGFWERAETFGQTCAAS